MIIIDDADKARRLARALCSDVMLYNQRVTQLAPYERGAGIAAPIQEARQLFATRVAPALASLFDEAVAELVARPLGIDPSSIVAPPFAPDYSAVPLYGAPPFVGEPAPVEHQRRPRRRSNVPIVAAIFFLVLAAACAYFLPRLHW